MKYFQPEIECMDRESIRKNQLENLKKQVKRVYENVQMYRERMDEMGVKPDEAAVKKLVDEAHGELDK